MKYLISGIIAGFAAGIFFFQSASGMEIVPEFYSGLDSLDVLQPVGRKQDSKGFVVMIDGRTYVVDHNGSVLNRVDHEGALVEFSGNGLFYTRYGKVSTDIELLGVAGERYLKMKSAEKPLLSYNAGLMLLVNGDHSRIRIFDKNGMETGARQVSGRLCTALKFSRENDFFACGFADGSYYFLDGRGNIINRGMVRSGDVVKGIAVSPSGQFGMVHYGNTDSDMLRLVDIASNSFDETGTGRVHFVKTAMHVSDSGEGAFFDIDAVILTDNDCDIDFRLPVPAMRPGYSTLSFGKGVYSLCYTKGTGESQLVLFKRDGSIVYAKEFSGMSFLGSEIRGNLLFARGSDSLFGYSIRP